jgi:hypothetical protein
LSLAHFSHHHGSSSLKHVLAAPTNLSGYDLEIGESTTASLKFMEAAFCDISDIARQTIQTDILTYYGQDTGGMIAILKIRQNLVRYPALPVS